jgi:hypothetical protein
MAMSLLVRKWYQEKFWLMKAIDKWLILSKQLFGDFFGGRGLLQLMFWLIKIEMITL